PRLAAKYADEFNMPFASVEDSAAGFTRVREACESAGRYPSSMTFSVVAVSFCGKDDASFRRRAEAIGREPGELREHGLAGSPAEVAARIAEYAEVGAERVYLQILDLGDLDHLELIAAEVAPQCLSGGWKPTPPDPPPSCGARRWYRPAGRPSGPPRPGDPRSSLALAAGATVGCRGGR
ncbi:MAG: hypothetical protein JO345_14480, partial [Streptosporangiaceae bacterium]|nr:hypothetical protein [Streptosporangiaceae bacterium]